jgi:uncharacterized radical SAM superfamily Fe-S cluster-containing enzyme
MSSRPPCCATLGHADHLYYAATRSLCRVCKSVVDAMVLFRDGAVVLEKSCMRHGRQQCQIASSVDWYLDALRFLAPRSRPQHATGAITRGCPLDCGLCIVHQQQIMLPVVPITSACNLSCPICYTINKNDDPYQMDRRELATVLDRLRADQEELDIINFTGGEPTLHAELVPFLEMCREAGVRRLTVSTNGLALDRDKVAELKRVDARMIVSVDTFDQQTDLALHGRPTHETKLRALDSLCDQDVTTTILPTIAAGFNDSDLPLLLDLILTRPNIVSLEIHTMCFTGQGGVGFQRAARISIPEIHSIIEGATRGRIRGSDFVPSPLAHPHCYSICYLLMLGDGDRAVPFARFMGRQRLFELLGDSLYIEPRDRLERVLLEVIDELWVSPEGCDESALVLRALRQLIDSLYPRSGAALSLDERRRRGERAVKAIYIHSHMDEESFDVSRIMACCVAVPFGDGSAIPTCAYNVLYRERDPRFRRGEGAGAGDCGRARQARRT